MKVASLIFCYIGNRFLLNSEAGFIIFEKSAFTLFR